MALTLNTEPKYLNLVRNPIPFKVTSDNYKLTNGSVAVFEVDVDLSGGEVAANDTINISFSLANMVFVFKVSPDHSGLQLPTNSGGGPMDDWAADVITYKLKNYWILRYYTVTWTNTGATSGTFTFTAKNIGTDYSASVSVSSARLTVGTNTAGVDPTYNSNFTIRRDVYIEETWDSGTYTFFETDELTPDADSVAQFYLERVLNYNIFATSPFLRSTWPTTAERLDITKRFKVKYYEVYGGTPEPQEVYEAGPYIACLGGLNWWDFPAGDFFTRLSTTKEFMTNSPDMQIFPNQPRTLSFCCYSDAWTSLTLKVRAYFSDSTNETATIVTKGSPVKGEVYIMPCGLSDIAAVLSVPADAQITRVQLWLENNSGSVVSEVKTYSVNYDYAQNYRYWTFKNALGGFDHVTQIGFSQLESDYMSQNAEQYLDDYVGNTAAWKGKFTAYGGNSQDKMTVNMGNHFTKAQIDWLTEMMQSDLISFKNESGQHIPVVIIPGTFTRRLDVQDRYRVSFECKIAYQYF